MFVLSLKNIQTLFYYVVIITSSRFFLGSISSRKYIVFLDVPLAFDSIMMDCANIALL